MTTALPRRPLLGAAFGAALLVPKAHAQGSFRNQPVRLVVSQAAGSNTDVVARLMADPMARRLGQPVVVENRAGANGVIATTFIKQQRPDGHVIALVGVSLLTFNPYLYSNLPYDVARDFTMIAPVSDTPFVLIASPKSGIKSLSDLVQRAKAQPGKLTYSSSGIGNSTHLATEMLADRTRIQLTHIPYGGTSQGVTAVMTGEVDLMTVVLGNALPQIRDGALVPLATVAAGRTKALPELPTLAELGVDAPVMPGWLALIGPAGMPESIVATLNEAAREALSDPALLDNMDKQNIFPIPGTADDIRARVKRDGEVWGGFIKAKNLRVE
ncbi:Bug family tripartite tricarboxylate transporter substrate binding protein [Roseomonas xinghualingensis]|uniref:Bug family tripartite tricarboxylate transporter substrate binding protein n=1 Tax=Roseomonas xinghualingensis TaxID=2986475 RepID=UPI0021F22619|nr:tripartite tricarboxylate transporter substrate binding protein [Roseomonas sp. SXEYE001]MCV4209964.1 tripartite tricarboxylate transporter substrate binding protein [Roseomonas sp. SXEYE001]